ncbi:MAG: nitroreductase [Pseudomonadota bacterium]
MTMTPIFHPPEFGQETPACQPSVETVELLARRRSTAADFLTGPGPDHETLQQILRIAARAPDHSRVVPFRFILLEGDERAAAGDVLAENFAIAEPGASPDRVEKERVRFLRAPVIVTVVSCLKPEHKIPVWEQMLTVGAVCQNMLIAANAHGFASQWLTEWYAYDDAVKAAFRLAEGEEFAGFIYIGTASTPPKERARPVLGGLITRYGV